MKIFRKSETDETFVRVIQVARENQEIGDMLRAVLGLDAGLRASAVANLVSALEKAGAPKDLTGALLILTDDGAAEKARDLLQKK